MTNTKPQFKAAFAYSGDVHHLPVKSVDVAAEWYGKHFSMIEVERNHEPVPNVTLERDGVRIGFSENGGDSSQNGAAVLVHDLSGVREEFEARGLAVANERIDERDGKKYKVLFVVAPDGLCYYFHEPE